MKTLTNQILILATVWLCMGGCDSDPAPTATTPLPATNQQYSQIFQAWIGADATDAPMRSLTNTSVNLRRPMMVGADALIAKHALYIHVPEAYNVLWLGRTFFTAPSLAGTFEPNSIAMGLATRSRLKSLNPNIKLFVQIGYTEGADAYTDFPPDHPWWLRDAYGNRQPGWGDAYLFNLDLPEVRQHCANSCKVAMDAGIWDGLFLDVGADDPNHVDLLRRIRALCGDWPITMNVNYHICPNLAPLLNGFYMECGDHAPWSQVVAALDFNERHVIQPAINLLEISGPRSDAAMLHGLALALTRSNGLYLYSDPVTHAHKWWSVWDVRLGRPLTSTQQVGGSSQRVFEHGTAVFNPPPGVSTVNP